MTSTDAVTANESSESEISYRLASGELFTLPPHDEFYDQLITRNRGLVTDEDQRRLRSARILVAGSGSIGGAVVEPLVRFGAERLTLAEPGEYDLHNLNRQNMRVSDVGRNKAEVLRERALDINPYASIAVDTRGIADENVEELVRQATLIIDGVDVTTEEPLRLKLALHEQARRYKVPVISGYDIAGLQLLQIYDYRLPGTKPLNGRVRADGPEVRDPMVFLRRVVPIAAIPYEIIGELRRQLRGERSGFPQIVYTANLFGVLTVCAALDLLAGRPVRKRTIIDVPMLLRPVRERMRVRAARLVGLYQLNKEFRARRFQTTDVVEAPVPAPE